LKRGRPAHEVPLQRMAATIAAPDPEPPMTAAALFDRQRLQSIARRLGESETVVRHLLLACAALAALAAFAWAAGCMDATWLAEGHPGALRVLHALIGLAALSFASVVALLLALGHWETRATRTPAGA
jgi:hypothetical protein